MARVLLVDDDPELLASLQELLQKEGFEVVATTGADQATAFLADLPPEAAIVDVVMPNSSGYDLLRKLRSHPLTADIPIIFVSGLSAPQERIRGLDAGADDYLVKPFAPEELVVRLKKLLAVKEAARAKSPAAQIEAGVRKIEQVLNTHASVTGIMVGRYRLDSILGKGGHGVVFRAFDSILLRPVAMKMLHMAQEGESFWEQRSSLLKEAVVAARLSHPHIVGVYDFQEARNAAFIVMELVEGVGLDRYLLAKGSLSQEETIMVGLAVSKALASAHQQRLVHRDLKPANVLLGRDGAIKVSDFGIATFLSAQARAPGEVFGTPGFLAPECICGRPYDEKGDLFALGVTLYLCLTGSAPFATSKIVETLERTLSYDPPPPHLLRADVGEEISHLIMRLLAKERARRPASAGEVAHILEQWVKRGRLSWEPDVGAMERALTTATSFFPSSFFPTRGGA